MSIRELSVLLAMCVAWGLHFVVIKTAVAEIPPMYYAAIRMSLVAALMAPFLRWRKGQMLFVFCGGICLGALNYALMFSGLLFTTASAAAVAMELYVPFATILSIFFLGDQLGWRRVVGITLAFIGVAIIATGKETGGGENMLLGIALVAVGAFSEAVGAVFVKKATSFEPHQLLAWFGLVGAVGLWIGTFLFESGQSAALAAADKTMIIGAIVYSALIASIFGHSAYYWLLKRLPVSMVAPSLLLTTLLAVTFSVLLLGDPFGMRMAIGGVMTLFGVGVVLLRSAKKQANNPALTEPPG